MPSVPAHDGDVDAGERSRHPLHPAILGHAELSTTEIYTQVSIRMLKEIHSATHPAAQLDHEHTQPTPAETTDNQAQEELFAALDAEAEEEHEKPTEQKKKAASPSQR